MYIENFRHRECWIRLFISVDPAKQETMSVLHNLLAEERTYVLERLEDPVLHPLTLHPLFVPTLVIELLHSEILQLLDLLFISSVRLYIAADLHADDRYSHLRNRDLDVEQELERSLGYEQRILILSEKMQSTIQIGRRLLGWFGAFETCHMTSELQSRFRSAGSIIENRLQYLVDTLDLQMIRLKRTQGHTQLSRLGVSYYLC